MNLFYTPWVASLLAILFVGLSVRVILHRRSVRVALGAGEDRELQRRMRVHANFSEYTPLALILLFLAEIQQGPELFIGAGAALLLLGRLCHAFGVSRTPENFRFRVSGMSMTFTSILFFAVANIYSQLFAG